MINPLYGVYLDNQYYEYVAGTYRATIPLKNNSSETHSSKAFTVQGKGFLTHTVLLHVGNTYYVQGLSVGASMNIPSVSIGITSWLGVSRLFYLLNVVGGRGSSMGANGILFVAPDGSTHSVVPTGSVDIQVHNPDAPNDAGVEYRISLTLENTQ